MNLLKPIVSSRPKTFTALLGCAGILASLAVLAGARVYTGGSAVAATAEAPSYPSGAICHTPSFTGRAIQLAQTEVSPMARQAAPDPAAAFESADPPLWSNLGTITYKITTANPEAQKYFDQGLRLAYAFNHAEARRAFRKAQKLDPNCAMCFWGEALVLGPHVNMGMVDDAVAPAWAALTKAKELASRAAPNEQALIEALSHRYAPTPQKDRAPLDKAYADAMGRAAKQFPDDIEILTLYAEALMDLSPWDYWRPGGAEPNPQSVDIVPTLERVLAKDPNHAGAIHLYIHAVEASDRPERAEPYADRLVGQMPGAGHMVHMPSHIYYRVGRYKEALKTNIDAVAADETYLKETGAPPGVYRLGYYPHNVHFVLATGQMSGDGPTVISAAEKLQSLIPEAVAKTVPFVQPIKQAPYYAHAQFSTPEVILAVPAPDAELPFVKAAWHYARAIAFVKQGNMAGAETEADAIVALEKGVDFSALTQAGIPANDVLKIADHVIQGRIAQAKGDANAAVAAFEKAATLQDTLRYMEPPFWYYPVRQSLAAALVQAKRYDAAEEQFRLSLQRAPNNAWSYYGLAELHKARGDSIAMARAEELLNQSWVGDRKLLQLSNL
ncbi:MAG TPA: tetratricopeptide repeat protein [Alphaproteobacteria bacterium]|nr:tetratricopeptide repeat protein [Alphaproteobacteria bacterium]